MPQRLAMLCITFLDSTFYCIAFGGILPVFVSGVCPVFSGFHRVLGVIDGILGAFPALKARLKPF
jgi:hypothetical protein